MPRSGLRSLRYSLKEIILYIPLLSNFTPMIKLTLERTAGEYGFTSTDEKGHQLRTDTSEENGGNNYGFRPMQLLLSALGSCSAIDLVSILKKQRQNPTSIRIEVEGEREQGQIPSLWKDINLTFHLTGALDKDKTEKAVALSMEKYCSVAETLRRGGTTINWITKINEDEQEGT
jgi:putative redox protein